MLLIRNWNDLTQCSWEFLGNLPWRSYFTVVTFIHFFFPLDWHYSQKNCSRHSSASHFNPKFCKVSFFTVHTMVSSRFSKDQCAPNGIFSPFRLGYRKICQNNPIEIRSYTCGKTLLHLWLIITHLQITTHRTEICRTEKRKKSFFQSFMRHLNWFILCTQPSVIIFICDILVDIWTQYNTIQYNTILVGLTHTYVSTPFEAFFYGQRIYLLLSWQITRVFIMVTTKVL